MLSLIFGLILAIHFIPLYGWIIGILISLGGVVLFDFFLGLAVGLGAITVVSVVAAFQALKQKIVGGDD